MTNVYALLHKMQKEMKVPKNQHNKFGGYNYRSCEDILEEAKQHLPDNAALIVNDELVNVGDRYYVKATALLCVGDSCVSATAYAREAETKKGMDEAQITGSASSYARKYALNGLFCIDDTKDADTQDNRKRDDLPVFNNSQERANWLITAKNEMDKCKTSEALSDWINKNITKINALGDKQREWVNTYAGERKQALTPEAAE